MNPNPSATPTTTFLPIDTAISNCNSHNNLCHEFVTNGACNNAASRYDDTVYSQYTSHWFNFQEQEGCTAIFEYADGYPAGGMSGADIKGYLADIYAPIAQGCEDCGICGACIWTRGAASRIMSAIT